MVVINGEKFLTVKDMAGKLKKTPDSVKKLLHRADIRPLSKDALYPYSAYETIKEAPSRGRPRKAKTNETSKPLSEPSKKARK